MHRYNVCNVGTFVVSINVLLPVNKPVMFLYLVFTRRRRRHSLHEYGIARLSTI